jgi:hypothetical protein
LAAEAALGMTVTVELHPSLTSGPVRAKFSELTSANAKWGLGAPMHRACSTDPAFELFSFCGEALYPGRSAEVRLIA